MPTNSPRALSTGLPELPPVVSALDRKFTGRRRCARARAAATSGLGRTKGFFPVSLANNPDKVVKGTCQTPSRGAYPATWAKLTRGVRLASG